VRRMVDDDPYRSNAKQYDEWFDCEEYKYSFAGEEVKRYLSAEEWWLQKFGNDLLWAKP